ncbi:hypothetical protein ACF087_34435 [Streptomyces goshikiensis]|uniref:hypothetical protein n=1 Tax=Streptomyces goshikiensis TaxID=1942 RepID=UPI0036F53197
MNGDTLIELSQPSLSWDSAGYLLDPEKTFSMVDWSALEEFVRENDCGPTGTGLWFAHVREADRRDAGLRPNECLYLRIVDGVARVRKAAGPQAMRYLVTVP